MSNHHRAMPSYLMFVRLEMQKLSANPSTQNWSSQRKLCEISRSWRTLKETHHEVLIFAAKTQSKPLGARRKWKKGSRELTAYAAFSRKQFAAARKQFNPNSRTRSEFSQWFAETTRSIAGRWKELSQTERIQIANDLNARCPGSKMPRSVRKTSGYSLFTKDTFRCVREEMPGLSCSEIFREISKRWQSLNLELKNQYKVKAAATRRQFDNTDQ